MAAAGHAGSGGSSGTGAGGMTSAGAGGAGAAGMSSGGMSAAGGGPPCNDMDIPCPSFKTFKFVLQNSRPVCGGASPCHGVGTDNPLAMPTMDDTTLMRNLTTIMSVECGNIPVLTPGDPTKSALIKLLNGPCGMVPQMPYGCVPDPTDDTCLPPEYIAAITQWVANGAPTQ
jgi:hypothetical protein